MLELDCFSAIVLVLLGGILRRGKSSVYIFATAASHGFKMVLRPTLHRHVVVLCFEAVSHRNNFVGGTCAPLSALLVEEEIRIM